MMIVLFNHSAARFSQRDYRTITLRLKDNREIGGYLDLEFAQASLPSVTGNKSYILSSAKSFRKHILLCADMIDPL
jgi:hypothetical protein